MAASPVVERRRGQRRGAARPVSDRRGVRALRPGEALGLAPLLVGLTLTQAVVALLLGLGWWGAALALHLACCLALPLIRPILPEEGWSGAVARLLRALLPGLGPLAVLGALAALALGMPRRLRAAVPPLPEDPLDARLEALATARPGTLPDGLLLESLADVLRWGHAGQKARALDIAADPARPAGVALLRLALGDPDPAVRARAEALRPAVEQRLLDRAEVLHAAARGGAGAEGLATQRALARALDRAALSGLLEPAAADAARAEAAGLWQALAESAGPAGDAEAEAALGRALLALGDLPAARLALDAAVMRGAAGETRLAWLAECLFRARDFAALEALVQRWRPALEDASRRGATGPEAGAWRLWLSATQR
jgi:hypothetical protein